MNKILIFFLLFVSIAASADDMYLVKNNGSKIKIKKCHVDDAVVVATSTSNKKVRIACKDVLGYYYTESNNMVYLIGLDGADKKKKYGFAGRVLEGKIKIYTYVVQGVPGYSANGPVATGSTTYLIAEKDNKYYYLKTKKKDDVVAKIQSLIKDDPESLKEFEKGSFKYNKKFFLEFFGAYNIRNFSPSGVSEKNATVVLKWDAGTDEGALQVKVNGESYFLTAGNELKFTWPTAVDTMVCFLAAGKESCTLEQASPYFTKEIVVKYNEYKGIYFK